MDTNIICVKFSCKFNPSCGINNRGRERGGGHGGQDEAAAGAASGPEAPRHPLRGCEAATLACHQHLRLSKEDEENLWEP